MKSRKIIGWIMAGCVCLAVIAAWALTGKSKVSLPAIVDYPSLPAEFAEALKAAQHKVKSTRFGPAELRNLAQLYHANRLFAEARSCYSLIAESSSGSSAQDHYYLADIAQQSGDLRTAESELRATLRLEPGYAPARISLAETYFKLGDENAAAAEYALVLKEQSNHPQASLGIARLELQQGQDDAAIARLEALLAAHPEATSGAALLAQVLDRRGQRDRAAALTEWSKQKREPVPPDPWLDALLDDCYDGQRLALKFEELLYTGQMDAALPLLDRVERLDPSSWTPHLLKGWSHTRAARHREALNHFNQALAKGGDPERICPLMISSLLALNDVAGAATLASNYAEKFPSSVPLLTLHADVAVRQGDLSLAKSLLTRVLEKEPYLYTQNMSLAKILWDGGERDAAIKCLQRVASVFPVDVASRGLVAQYFLEKGDARAAIPPLEQALPQAAEGTPARQRLSAMLDVAYRQQGQAEAEAGNFDEALSWFQKAAQLMPANLDAWMGEANVLVQLGRFGEAADRLQKLSAAQPDNPTIRLSWGDVLYQNGNHDGARDHWRQALALTPPEDVELRRVLELRLNGPITADTFR